MQKLLPGLIAGLLWCSPALADPVVQWQGYREDGDMDWLEASDWTSFATNYPMDIGMVSQAKYSIAWREGRDVGVLLRYLYADPVSPPELPGPGPMTEEWVEVTISCDRAVSRIHRMYLYAAEGRTIGLWFDPAMEANPSSYSPASMIGMAARQVC